MQDKKFLDKINLLNVEDRAKQLQLNHVYKIYNGNCPNCMLENFNRVGARQRIITRASANNFFVSRVEKLELFV